MAIAPVKRPSSNCRSVASPGTTVTFVPTSRAASAAVELGVELYSSYLVCPVAQQVRGHAGPGADLEHVITEARTRRCVRKVSSRRRSRHSTLAHSSTCSRFTARPYGRPASRRSP